MVHRCIDVFFELSLNNGSVFYVVVVVVAVVAVMPSPTEQMISLDFPRNVFHHNKRVMQLFTDKQIMSFNFI